MCKRFSVCLEKLGKRQSSQADLLDTGKHKERQQFTQTTIFRASASLLGSDQADCGCGSENIRAIKRIPWDMITHYFQWYSSLLFLFAPSLPFTIYSGKDMKFKNWSLITYKPEYCERNCLYYYNYLRLLLPRG